MLLSEPISFWGGVDPATGRIIDPRHPEHGRTVAGAVLLMTESRGSSSSSSILAECVRRGTAPAAIGLRVADPILAVGSVAAAELYGVSVPVVEVDGPTFERIRDGEVVDIEADDDGSARVAVTPRSPR